MLGFLDVLAGKAATKVPCLYEGQISVLITGIDDHRYETLHLADAFFDEGLSAKRAQEFAEEGGKWPDPFTKRGRLAAATIKCSPRDFFLVVSGVWSGHVLTEWNTVVDTIETAMKQQ